MTFLTIARKDLRVIFRDRSALIFTFAMPLIFVFIFGSVFGGRGGGDGKQPALKILIANEDQGPHGAELLASMKAVGLIVDQETGGANALTQRVGNGDRAVGVVIPEDFSTTIDDFVKKTVNGEPGDKQAHLAFYVDPAKTSVAPMAQGAVSGAAQRVTGQLYAKAFGQNAPSSQAMRVPVTLEAAELPQDTTVAVRTKRTPGDLIIPGFMVYFVFFLANSVAIALINERQEGTLRRMLSAPITPGTVLLGKLVARGALGVIQVLMLYSIGLVWLHLSIPHSPVGVVIVALSTIFTATGLGLLIASFGKTIEQIQGMTTLLLLVMGMLSGSLIPRELLPESVQKLSLITPHAWALNAYQDLILRDKTLIATSGNIAMVLVFGAVFYGLALARFRYE